MTRRFSAFVLCAGYGERLKPVTLLRPKPLLPTMDGTVLSCIFNRLFEADCRKFAINTHHLTNQFDHFALSIGRKSGASKNRTDYILHEQCKSSELVVVSEQSILGTGGGLGNLYNTVKPDGPVLVHNGDVHCIFDPERLIDAHLVSGRLATLVLVRNGPADHIEIQTDGAVASIYGNPFLKSYPKMTYTGIAVMEPRFLASFPVHPGHLVPQLIDWMEKEPGSVGWFEIPQECWQDLGTVERYLGNLVGQYNSARAKSILPEMQNTAALLINEGSKPIPKTALLRNLVLLDGGEISRSDVFNGGIIAPGCSVEPGQFRAYIPEKLEKEEETVLQALDAPRKLLGSEWTKNFETERLADAGSARSFYRIKPAEGDRYVIMDCHGDIRMLQRYLAVTRAMTECSLNPPRTFAYSLNDTTAVLEDLGDRTLLKQFGNCSSDRDTEILYKPIVEYLASFQVEMHRNLAENQARSELQRKFNFWLFMWEGQYFFKHFVRNYCGVSADSTHRHIKKELADIAGKAAALPQFWCHRDFQSTNILLKNGVPRVVDFQDSRPGPSLYDLASLLRDSYVRIGESAESELVNHYCGEIEKQIGEPVEYTKIIKDYKLLSVSRGMQVLGAFAKLSLTDGKRYFEAHIPRGLTRLRQVLSPDGDYPALSELVWSLDPMDRLEKTRNLLI